MRRREWSIYDGRRPRRRGRTGDRSTSGLGGRPGCRRIDPDNYEYPDVSDVNTLALSGPEEGN